MTLSSPYHRVRACYEKGPLLLTTNFAPYLPRPVIDWFREDPARRFRTVEGSMVFVDISGFTAMSERLARLGKVGSEEVTEVINSTFTRLLAVAYEDGGSLLKFGGDALLLLYTGTDHAVRACHAAAGMRQKLRDLGPIPTSAGMVRLRMSVGVHTGEYHAFLVGEEHRELIVAGPAASTVVRMEAEASAGEILISEATAGWLDPRLLGASRAGGVLLRKAPPAPRVQAAPSVPPGGGDLAALIPQLLHDRIGSAESHGEHRQVSIGFLSIGDIDARAADAEGLADLLEQMVVAIQHECARAGLCFLYSDIASDGAKVIVLAGAPQSNDDDEERLVHALHAVTQRDLPLPVRAGIHRGHVFVGEIGPPYRRTYTVIGDAVNLAARVMGHARPGTVLATADVLSRCGDHFKTEALAPFTAKGKAKPVSAEQIVDVRIAHEGANRDTPLFGRRPELSQLKRAAAASQAGTGRFVEIVGDPGIGKTRLVEDVLAPKEDVRRIRCDAYASSIAYHAIGTALRGALAIDLGSTREAAGTALLDHLVHDAPALLPWAPLIAIAIDADVAPTEQTTALDESVRPQRLRQVAGDLLARILPAGAVICFDDAHLMDEASKAFLRAFAHEHVDRMPWLILTVGRRTDIALEDDRLLIEVGPLADADAVLLARAIEDAFLPAELSMLVERSGGNPFFLGELVRSASPGAIESLPPDVEQVVVTRLDRLDAKSLGVLRTAAVVGHHFDPSFVERTIADAGGAAPEAGVWDRLADFLEPAGDGRMRFRQSLFRDVAYEALPYRRRRALHEQIGNALAARPGTTTALLATHFHHAGRFDKAWTYARTAGEEARERYALNEAANMLRRALDAGRQLGGVAPTEIASIYESLGDVMQKTGRYEEAAEAFREARRTAAAERIPHLMLLEAAMRERWGQYVQAMRWISRGLKAAAEIGDPLARATAQVRLQLGAAWIRYRQGRYNDGVVLAGEALLLTEHFSMPDQHAKVCVALDAMYSALGDKEKARTHRTTGLALCEELGDLRGQAQLLSAQGVDAYFDGRWDDALDAYARARAIYERIGIVVDMATTANNSGEILADQGRFDEAIPLFEEAIGVWRAARFSLGVALATANLGRAAARAGRLDEAAEMLDEALQSFVSMGAGEYALRTRALLVERCVFAGDHQSALARCEEAFEQFQAMAGLPDLLSTFHRLRGYAALQAGNIVLAQDSLDEALMHATSNGLRFERALALEALGRESERTGRNADDDCAGGARKIFDALGVRHTPAVPLPKMKEKASR